MITDFTKETIRIGTLAGKGPRTAEYVAKLLPLGFESFQLNFFRGLEGVLAESQAVVSSLAVYGNPLEQGPEDRETLEGLRAAIDHAALFGCDLVCGFAGRVRGKPVPDSIPAFKRVWGDLAERAADKGVRLAFENCPMGGTWGAGDWNIAFCPDAWELMFDAVPAPNLGLEWEPCHQLCQLIDPMPQLRRWVKKVFHVHGKDANVHWDRVRDRGVLAPEYYAFHRFPGQGDCNWAHIVSELRKGGFSGSIDIEGWHDAVYAGEFEMMGQVNALQYLKQCRGAYVPNVPGF